MINSLISYFDKKTDDVYYLIRISIFLLASKFIYFVLHKQYRMYESEIALKSVLKLNCLIFDKLLKISPSSTIKISNQGEIINYFLVDSTKLGKAIMNCPQFVVYCAKIAIYLYLLLYFLGISFLFGLIPIISILYMNYYLFKELPQLQDNYLMSKDERMIYSSETLDQLKLLKMYSWENLFKDKVYFIDKLMK